MDLLEIFAAHGVDVEHVDGVPYTWGDVIDRLVVDLKDLGWRGRLRSIAACDGSLEVDLGGDVSPAMLARIARAVDEARHVCEECGAAAREDQQGRALCSRCAMLDMAVAAALEAAPDDATLGALVYELYCAWDIRRRIARFDRERESGELRTYSSDEVFEELRRWSIEGPPLSPAEPPITLSPADWDTFVEALERPPEPRDRLRRLLTEPSALDAADRRSRFLARLRRERAWETALAATTRSVTLSGVSWETCLTLRREASGARASYRAGTLEIREPGPAHRIAAAALTEAIATVTRATGASLEIVPEPTLDGADSRVIAAPDLAVVSPGASRHAELVVDVAFDASAAWRLEIYALLGIPEVWHLDARSVEILLLAGGTYCAAKASALVPPLRRLTLRHIVEAAVRGDLVDARRYTERVLGER